VFPCTKTLEVPSVVPIIVVLTTRVEVGITFIPEMQVGPNWFDITVSVVAASVLLGANIMLNGLIFAYKYAKWSNICI
jgi:hypothetical protein